MNRLPPGSRLFALVLCVGITVPPLLLAQQPAGYATAAEAAAALVDALKNNDKAALDKVMGSDWREYIPVDDVDREDVDAFLAKYDEKHVISVEGGTSHLVVGQGWTLPIPLVQRPSGWAFDPVQGREEIRVRQIGNNELATLHAMFAYCDAQNDYASEDRNGDGVLEYAQKLISTAGQHDGLYWTTSEGETMSPLGPAFAGKEFENGYYGYRYRILTAQGPSAPGAEYDYVTGGHMRNGFAVVAWPDQYGATGVMTFMVSHDRVAFQKDLGADTTKNVQSIERFDPDSSWQEVSEED